MNTASNKLVNKDTDHIKGALTLTASAIALKALGFIYKIPLSVYLGDEDIVGLVVSWRHPEYGNAYYQSGILQG